MKRIVTLLWLAVLTVGTVAAQSGWLPEKTQRLVNDYSGVLSDSQRDALEHRLVAFNDSTSNQVLVVITPSLGGDEVQAVAQQIGETWGVGQGRFDNGVVLLIKSKTPDEDWGEVAIATGYGVEGALPDVFCKRIIEDEMVGPLGEGDYHRAIVKALDIILPVMQGEYSYVQYRDDELREALIGFGVLGLLGLVAIIVLVIYAKKHPDKFNNNQGGGGTYFGGTPGGFWSSGGGGFFSGGSRSGGGFSSGGFGGFGGGHFGGGGASGRF